MSYLQLFPLFTLFYNFSRNLFIGGGKEDRTPDPLLAKQVLSQLSYTPNLMVGLGRLELPTSRLSGVRSNHLSYKPLHGLPPFTVRKEDIQTAHISLLLFFERR